MRLNMQLVLFYSNVIMTTNLTLWDMTPIPLIKLNEIILSTIENYLPLSVVYSVGNISSNLPLFLSKSTLIIIISVTTDPLTILHDVLLII